MTPSSSRAKGPSTTSEAVVQTTVSGCFRTPIDEVRTFFRDAPDRPAVSRAWAYSSRMAREALRPSSVRALDVRHRMRLSRVRSLKKICSRLILVWWPSGSRSFMMARISSKQIFACW